MYYHSWSVYNWDFVDDKAKSAEQQAGDEVDGALKDDAIQKLDVAIEALSAAQKQKELSTEESKHVSELKIVAESLKTLHMDTADQIKRSINDLTNHASTLKLSVAESAEHAGAKETAKINSASDAGLKALEAKLDTCKEKLTSTHESLMNVYKTQHERLMAEMNQKHIDYSEQQEEKFRKDMEEMDLKHQQWLERETKQNQLLTDKAAQKIGHQRQLAERQGDHLLKKIEVKQDHFIANSQAKFDDNKKLADEVRNELTSCINQVYVMTVELAKTKKQLAAMQQTNYSTWEGMLVNLEAAGRHFLLNVFTSNNITPNGNLYVPTVYSRTNNHST